MILVEVKYLASGNIYLYRIQKHLLNKVITELKNNNKVYAEISVGDLFIEIKTKIQIVGITKRKNKHNKYRKILNLLDDNEIYKK